MNEFVQLGQLGQFDLSGLFEAELMCLLFGVS